MNGRPYACHGLADAGVNPASLDPGEGRGPAGLKACGASQGWPFWLQAAWRTFSAASAKRLEIGCTTSPASFSIVSVEREVSATMPSNC